MYVIIVASGNTGKVITNVLLNAGKEVRVISRDAGKVPDLTDNGAEPAISKLEDVKRNTHNTTPTSLEDFAQTFAHVYKS